MISAKKDYQNIRSDREISANLEILEIILSKSDTERFENNKEILDSIKKEFKSWKSQLNDISPRLAIFLDGKNHLIDTINEELKNKRTSSTKPIKEIIKPLFWRMEDLGYRPIQQQKFIYDIYAENGFDAYAENKDDLNKPLLDRIEKDQIKAKQEYTSAQLGEIKKSLPSSE